MSAGNERIGIFGGTFNPPHLGHLAAVRGAMEQLHLDKLYMIPACQPPHKSLPEGSPTAEQRLEMTRIAADGLGLGDKVEVLDIELARGGKSYTADTLAAVKARHPAGELWFLMGADMFLTVHQWYQPEKIAALAGLAGFARSRGEDAGAMEAQRAFLEERYGAKAAVLHLPGLVEVSSTQLRGELAAGGGEELLPQAVYGYILRHKLYGTHADLKALTLPQLRAASYSMIKAKRVPHVKGTEETAAKLARLWGAPEEDARRAAILHDCTKYLTLPQQLKLCERYGILLDDLEQRALKLLHSKTGAALAKDWYGQPDRICAAIFWHTTGKADMTLLEKIIYLADYMEPTRDFDGVEPLRDLAWKDLDRAVLLGLEMTIEEMRAMGNPVHWRTVEARDWLKGHLK